MCIEHTHTNARAHARELDWFSQLDWINVNPRKGHWAPPPPTRPPLSLQEHSPARRSSHPLRVRLKLRRTLPGSPSEKHSCIPGPVSGTVLLCSCRKLGASRRLLRQLIRRRCWSGHGSGAAPLAQTDPGSLCAVPTVYFVRTESLPNFFSSVCSAGDQDTDWAHRTRKALMWTISGNIQNKSALTLM